ncbi:MAG: galactokinase family protein [Oscillospiraceae bacterium]
MNQNETIRALLDGAYDECLQEMYVCTLEELVPYRQRYIDAIEKFGEEFGTDGEIMLFSAAGRTELCGNHTDHQGGHVLAGSINLDMIAVASKRDNEKIRLKSEGFLMDSVELSDLTPQPDEVNSSSALLRGISARFRELGYPVNGFDAYTTSDVLRGSGLSSSAAFEVLVGNICNFFFAEGRLSTVEIAKIGQYAENFYFGKPCGLEDQLACSVGGVIAIDFKGDEPVIEQTSVNLAKEGYALCILDSNADHANLTEAYSAIPAEMKKVARIFGKSRLCDVKKADFLVKVPEIREICGDRAVLRALHFFRDDKRVIRAVHSLQNGYFEQYLKEIRDSGASSFEYLQNVSTYTDPAHQEVALTIAICTEILGGRGAVRVHGGGFAGTVQAYVPLDMLDSFKTQIETVLGERHCHVLKIRPVGGLALTPQV